MIQYLALFRGINVGGKNIIPMVQLKNLMNKLGFHEITTYIQSGNVIFSSKEKDKLKIGNSIKDEIKKDLGFEPNIHILTKEEFEDAVKGNPFPESESDPKTLHLGFLSEIPESPDLEKMDSLKKESEQYRIVSKVFYLKAPEGIGRSKLAAASERLLGVSSKTDRNWRTVTKLLQLVHKK